MTKQNFSKNLFKKFFKHSVNIFKISFITLFAATCICVSGCAKNNISDENSLYSLKHLKTGTSSSRRKPVSTMRIKMLRDTALSVGARGGLANRSKQINKISEKYAKLLRRVFNFHGMLLDDSVIPPVLVEGRMSLNVAGPETLRIADRNYQIIKQASFVTAPPSWRDYLILNHCPPESPDKSLLPRNKAEVIIWKKYIEEGWKAGVGQANLIFDENLAKLTRDYKGMILYRTLLAKNMVTRPYVATVELGVTGNESAMNVNDKILRITALPGLNVNSEQWKAQVTRHD